MCLCFSLLHLLLLLFFLHLVSLSNLWLSSSIYHPFYSLYFFLSFSLSTNRIVNQKGEVPRANTLTHTHDQYKQLHRQQRRSVMRPHRLVHEHTKQTGTYLPADAMIQRMITEQAGLASDSAALLCLEKVAASVIFGSCFVVCLFVHVHMCLSATSLGCYW